MTARATAARWSVSFALVSALALALTGCPSDPYDPETWIEKLDEPTEAADALQKLQQLKDPKAIPALGAFWKKHNNPSKVLRIIIDLAQFQKVDDQTGKVLYGPTHEAAIPFLLEAVQNFDIGDQQSIDDASVAADALGTAAAAGHRDNETVKVLVNAANKAMPKLSPGQRVRIAAIRALGNFPASELAIDTLIKILETDMDKQPLKVHAAAINALGETHNPKALAPLLLALYKLSPLYPQVRSALAAIGKPAIPALIAVYKGDNKTIEAFAKDNNLANDCAAASGPDTKCQAPGNVEFKAAALLGDLRAKDAVPLFVESLKSDPKISFYDPQTGAPGPPTHSAVLDALRKIGDERAVEPVYAFWSDRNTDDALRPLAIDVYSTLTRDTKALDALEKLFKDDGEEEQIRLAAALAFGRLARSKSDLTPLEYMVARYKKPADENDEKAKKAKTEDAKAEFEGIRDSYRGYQRGFEENVERAKVGIACKDDPACYVKYLEAKDIRVGEMGLPRAERALLELAKLGKKASAVTPQVLKHADSTERLVRDGVLLALPQVAELPCSQCSERLAEVIEKQKDQTTLDYLTKDTEIVMHYFQWAGKGGS
jgi:hypothetical protein